MVENNCLEMDGFWTKADLDVIPLGSYDVLIGMRWMEKHFSILDCHNKTITCQDEDKNTIQIKGIMRLVPIRQVQLSK